MRERSVVAGLGAVILLSVLACGATNGTPLPEDAGAADAAPEASVGGCGSATPGVTPVCATYMQSSIAAMRGMKAAGCFELAHVGLVARTDSASEPRLYIQDATGADFSAMLAKCSPTAQHHCAPAVAAKIPRLLDTLAMGAKLTIRGYYLYGKVTTFEELYIEDILDECGAVPRPPPIALTVADIMRAARTPAKWFQRATVNVTAADPLVVYDFSPAELSLPATKCPNWEGFAMIPKSAGVAAATGCAGMTNPAGRPADPKEILFGRQFFNQFLYSSDCGCVAGTKQRLITPTNTVSAPIVGYLFLEQDRGAITPYQVFEPAADQTFLLK